MVTCNNTAPFSMALLSSTSRAWSDRVSSTSRAWSDRVSSTSRAWSERVVQFFVEYPGVLFYSTLILWWVGGGLSIYLPVHKWKKSRNAYFEKYGQYIAYEQAQRYQERAYQQAQEQQNNNYSYDNDGNYYDQNGNWMGNTNNDYNYNKCSWWQVKCRKQQAAYQKYQQQQYQYQQQNGGQQQQNQVYTPDWYQFLNGKQGEENRRDREDEFTAQQNGPVKFVYIWSLVAFVLVLLYGTAVFYASYRQRSIAISTSLLVALVMMLQSALLLLVLVPQGVIMVDDRDLENEVYGWYGQWPVLLVYFEYAICLFSGIAFAFFGILITFIPYAIGRLTRLYEQLQLQRQLQQEKNEAVESSHKPRSVTGVAVANGTDYVEI